MTQDKILTLDQLSAALKDRKLYVVARGCGVSYPTLRKIMMRKHDNFTLETLKKVGDYLSKQID